VAELVTGLAPLGLLSVADLQGKG